MVAHLSSLVNHCMPPLRCTIASIGNSSEHRPIYQFTVTPPTDVNMDFNFSYEFYVARVSSPFRYR